MAAHWPVIGCPRGLIGTIGEGTFALAAAIFAGVRLRRRRCLTEIEQAAVSARHIHVLQPGDHVKP